MNEPIIEKRPSSPIATSLLAVATVGLLAAIVMLGMMLKANTYGTNTPSESAKKFYQSEWSKDYKDAQKVTDANPVAETDEPVGDDEPNGEDG